MAIGIIKPIIHVEDANGNPYVGASLYVYQSGTTTLASIYSDTALSTALANPLTSDAAGNFPRAYIGAGTYKLRAEDADATLIWQYDAIDTGIPAGSAALAVANGGTGATTAAEARTNLGAAAASAVSDIASDVASLQSIVAAFTVDTTSVTIVTRELDLSAATTSLPSANIPESADSPATPTAGDIVNDSTDGLKVYFGGAWRKLLRRKFYESSATSVTAGTALTFAHGLGAKPETFEAVLKCTTADTGWAVGDEVNIGAFYFGSNAVPCFTVGADATNITFLPDSLMGTTPFLSNKGTAVHAAITALSNFQVVVRAWL